MSESRRPVSPPSGICRQNQSPVAGRYTCPAAIRSGCRPLVCHPRGRPGTEHHARMAVRRRRAGAHQVLGGRRHHGRQRGRTGDRLAMGAERDASRGLRHPAGTVPGDAPHDRQRSLPLHHVHARGGSRRGDGRRVVGLRSQGLRRRTQGRGAERFQAPGRCLVGRRKRRTHIPQQPRPAVRHRRRNG